MNCTLHMAFIILGFTVNLHHEHFIDPTNCPWVSEDGLSSFGTIYNTFPPPPPPPHLFQLVKVGYMGIARRQGDTLKDTPEIEENHVQTNFNYLN